MCFCDLCMKGMRFSFISPSPKTNFHTFLRMHGLGQGKQIYFEELDFTIPPVGIPRWLDTFWMIGTFRILNRKKNWVIWSWIIWRKTSSCLNSRIILVVCTCFKFLCPQILFAADSLIPNNACMKKKANHDKKMPFFSTGHSFHKQKENNLFLIWFHIRGVIFNPVNIEIVVSEIKCFLKFPNVFSYCKAIVSLHFDLCICFSFKRLENWFSSYK